ncbi:MAG: nucleotide exchange factor GrpE [Firmicutes bacterium]|nr:nucleotide exchange factor GrpE [Bacillota bacterium]
MAEETEELIEESQEGFLTLHEQIDALTTRAEVAETIVEKAKTRLEELDRLNARLQADFDNFRKRNAENAKKFKEDGIAEAAEKIIPLSDTLERAIVFTKDKSTQEGLKLVLRQFNDVLASLGVFELDAEGMPFNPKVHNAVVSEPVKDSAKKNIIIEVFQKGFFMADEDGKMRILRHSMVKVGK